MLLQQHLFDVSLGFAIITSQNCFIRLTYCAIVRIDFVKRCLSIVATLNSQNNSATLLNAYLWTSDERFGQNTVLVISPPPLATHYLFA